MSVGVQREYACVRGRASPGSDEQFARHVGGGDAETGSSTFSVRMVASMGRSRK